MPIGSSSGEYFADDGALLVDQAKKQQAITIRPVQEPSSTTSTMPVGSPTEPAGALKPEGGTNVPENHPETNFIHPTPDYMNPPENAPAFRPRTSEILKGFYDTAKNALGLTQAPPWAMDPETGEFHTSPQAIEKAADLAGLMIFGPAPVASKMAEGTLGSFAGVRSVGMKNKLSDFGYAQVLEAQGAHPEEIWNKTGFMRGAEGKWRYEIDDSKASFDRQWTDTGRRVSSFEGGPGERYRALTAILDHPELYKAYPQLKDIRVVVDPKYPSTGAEWASGSKTIRMGTEAAKNQGTLMHEIQHAIQDIEGFAKGGAPGRAEKDFSLKYTKDVEALIPESQDIIKKINTKGLTEEEYARSKYLTAVFKKYVEYKEAGNEEAAKYYLRLAGEAEARNTANRLYMTEEQRRALHPVSTPKYLGGEDIPREHQIVIKEPVVTSAYGVMDPKTGMIMKSEPTQFRRAANDNKKLDLGTGISEEELDKSWNNLSHEIGERLPPKINPPLSSEEFKAISEKHNKLFEDIEKLKKKDSLTELEKARLIKMQADKKKLFDRIFM